MENSEAELIFDVKQKFLREIPHPKLIQKQIDTLQSKFALPAYKHSTVGAEDLDITSCLEEYISLLMPLKLRLSNANSAVKLMTQLVKLKKLQMDLIKKLAGLIEDDKINVVEFYEIKQSEPFDVYNYIKELKLMGLSSDKEIKNYLCRQIEEKAAEDLTMLAKAVIRAKKILQHG